MSRIGKLPISVAPEVKIEQKNNILLVSGPKGNIELCLPLKIEIEQTSEEIKVIRKSDEKKVRALHGLWRVLISNAIVGVSQGWERKLDYKGVGFKAEVQDNKLILNLGFSHPIEKTAPEGITFTTAKNVITVSGIDKQKVGQVAADIRKLRPVEPYKGKGIKYIDEMPRKKLSKAAKAATSSA